MTSLQICTSIRVCCWIFVRGRRTFLCECLEVATERFWWALKLRDPCFCAAGYNAEEVSRYLKISGGLHNDIHRNPLSDFHLQGHNRDGQHVWRSLTSMPDCFLLKAKLNNCVVSEGWYTELGHPRFATLSPLSHGRLSRRLQETCHRDVGHTLLIVIWYGKNTWKYVTNLRNASLGLTMCRGSMTVFRPLGPVSVGAKHRNEIEYNN